MKKNAESVPASRLPVHLQRGSGLGPNVRRGVDMVATDTGVRLEDIAQDLFEVVTQLCLAVPRSRRRAGDLKEIEFFTLAILQDHGMMIVGDIQRLLGILPAQMSRVIRSLENRDLPLISCRINPQDKRKIDVCLTEAGEKALLGYQAVRVRRIAELLQDLPEEDQENVTHLLDKLRGLLERGAIA
jgi:DNA-binding MarR family transcriptional regulator